MRIVRIVQPKNEVMGIMPAMLVETLKAHGRVREITPRTKILAEQVTVLELIPAADDPLDWSRTTADTLRAYGLNAVDAPAFEAA